MTEDPASLDLQPTRTREWIQLVPTQEVRLLPHRPIYADYICSLYTLGFFIFTKINKGIQIRADNVDGRLQVESSYEGIFSALGASNGKKKEKIYNSAIPTFMNSQ